MVTIAALPQEILEHILSFVSPYGDLHACKMVCLQWYYSCIEVVKKRKSKFCSALKTGNVVWSTPALPVHDTMITRRFSHSACIHGSAMYVFGGCTGSSTTFNDLWKFNLGTHKWVRLLTTGTYPSPKAYGSIVAWNHFLILFGGWTLPSLYPLHQNWVLFDELHIYDILANRWTQIYYSGSPPPTAGHTATVHDDTVVIFGGLQKQESGPSRTNEIYCFNLKSQCWYKPKVAAEKPLPRYGHSQVKLDEKHLLIMAGFGGSNNLYKDVWLLKMPDRLDDIHCEWVWTSILVDGVENRPYQLWYYPACKVGNNLVLFSTLHLKKNSEDKAVKVPRFNILGPSRSLWMPSPESPRRETPKINHDEANTDDKRGILRPPRLPDGPGESSTSRRHSQRPSIRPNASCDREKRLQMLSRMEDKMRSRSRTQQHTNKQSADSGSNNWCLAPHLLDISDVVSQKKATWLPVPQNGDDVIPIVGMPKRPYFLYSLLLGRGHLIMFGGLLNDVSRSDDPDFVSSSVTFISAPS